jgi:hypothetical protein
MALKDEFKRGANLFFYYPLCVYFTKENGRYFLHHNNRTEEVIATVKDPIYKEGYYIITRSEIYGISTSLVKAPFMALKKNVARVEEIINCCPLKNPAFVKWVQEGRYMDSRTLEYFVKLISYKNVIVHSLGENVYEIVSKDERFYAVRTATHLKIFSKCDMIDSAKVQDALNKKKFAENDKER